MASSSGTSHVPSLLVSIPSPRGMLCRDSCLQLTHGTYRVYRATFLKIYLHRIIRQQLVLEIQEIMQRHNASPCLWTCRPSGWIGKKYSKFCNSCTEICKEVFNLESWLSCRRELIRRVCMVEQPRTQVSGMHVDKFLNPSTFPVLEIELRDRGVFLVQTFLRKLCCGSKRWSNQWNDLETSQSIGGRRFQNFWVAWCEDCVRREEDHHDPLLQEESESGGAKGWYGRSIALWKTDCVYDLRIFSGSWGTWSCSWLFRSTQYHFTWWRYWGFWYQMGSILLSASEVPNGKILDSLYKINSNQCGLYTNEKSIKINRSRVIRSWRPWWSDTKNQKIRTHMVLKGNQENAISGRQINRPLLLQHRRHKMTEEVLRKGNLPEAVVFLERDIKDRAEITSVKTVRICHVIIDILPYVKITKVVRDANLAQSAYSCTKRLTVSPTRSRRKVVVMDLVPYWRIRSNFGGVFQDFEPPKSKSISRKVTQFLGPKGSVHVWKCT